MGNAFPDLAEVFRKRLSPKYYVFLWRRVFSGESENLAMEAAWSTPRCILCGTGDEIAREHVIPRSIGGRLVARFLCRACNSRLGEGAESAVKNDPEIRKSIERLGVARPDLRDELQEGLKYLGHSGLGEVQGVGRKGRFIAKTRQHKDGSLIVPPESSFDHVTRMAAREGGSPLQVTADHLRNLPPGGPVEAAPNPTSATRSVLT